MRFQRHHLFISNPNPHKPSAFSPNLDHYPAALYIRSPATVAARVYRARPHGLRNSGIQSVQLARYRAIVRVFARAWLRTRARVRPASPGQQSH